MSLYYEDCREDAGCGNAFPFDPVLTAEAVIGAVLESERCPYAADVSLMLVTDEEIRAMNKETRNIDKATDVLSFPMQEFDHPADFSAFREGDYSVFDPASGELMLGDIVVNSERVAQQAKEYGHSQKREFAFLIAHSMLHLQGFDHIKADEAAEMEKAQNEILERLGIRR